VLEEEVLEEVLVVAIKAVLTGRKVLVVGVLVVLYQVECLEVVEHLVL
jgi:hypothetical protein